MLMCVQKLSELEAKVVKFYGTNFVSKVLKSCPKVLKTF